MATTSEFLGALVFLVAGSYQWTASKDVCLAQCQTPFAFPDASWRLSARCTGFHDPWPSPRRALRRLLLGADGAVVRGGVMNPLWVVLLALFILVEKITSSFGRLMAPIAGTLLMMAGTWLFILAAGLHLEPAGPKTIGASRVMSHQ